MDLILAEGTIFIFQMGMAILKMSALDLMTLDMEHMIRVRQFSKCLDVWLSLVITRPFLESFIWPTTNRWTFWSTNGSFLVLTDKTLPFLERCHLPFLTAHPSPCVPHQYFQNEVPQKASLDDGLESLIQSALDVKISAKKMKKWEKEYSQYKTKEDEEMVESRRLKTENKLLKQRIDHLEKVKFHS